MLLNVVFTSFNYAVGPPSMTNVRGFIAIKLSRLAVWIESTLTMRDLVLVASVFYVGAKYSIISLKATCTSSIAGLQAQRSHSNFALI